MSYDGTYDARVPMSQFWSYLLADGRRVLVCDNLNPGRYDPMVGFGVVMTIIGEPA